MEAFQAVRHAYEMLRQPAVTRQAVPAASVADGSSPLATVAVSLQDVCRDVHIRSSSADTCGNCHGAGVLIGMRSTRGGKHRHTRVRCTTCGGSGKTVGEAVRAGDAVRADDGRVVLPGARVVQLRIDPDPSFRRVGRWHLAAVADLSLCEALAGFTRTLVHPDGKSVTVGSDGSRTVRSGQAFRVAGRGIHGRGDLFVVFRVSWPHRIDERALERLRECLPGPRGVPSSAFHHDLVDDARSAGVHLPED